MPHFLLNINHRTYQIDAIDSEDAIHRLAVREAALAEDETVIELERRIRALLHLGPTQ